MMYILITVGNKTTMQVFGSQVFDPNSNTKEVQEWIKAVVSSGVEQVSINGSITYNITKGDTLKSIADKFNISLDELIEANPWLNENNLQKVVRKVLATSTMGSSLMEINSEIHKLITRADALSLKPTADDKPRAVKFIDYENLDNNEFLVVNQMK